MHIEAPAARAGGPSLLVPLAEGKNDYIDRMPSHCNIILLIYTVRISTVSTLDQHELLDVARCIVSCASLRTTRFVDWCSGF
jgi:hypothetical protein